MKISEFTKNLKYFFEEFFGSSVSTSVEFIAGGEFRVRAKLIKQYNWVIENEPKLFTIWVRIENETPMVTSMEFDFTGDEFSLDPKTLEDALVYIKESLATVKSKAIYDNL